MQSPFKLIIASLLIVSLLLISSAFACDPAADLTTKFNSPNGFTITNNSGSCLYRVGAAAYKKFDEIIDNQELYSVLDAATDVTQDGVVPLKPHKSVTFSVALPSCAYQLDAFTDPLLNSFKGGARYGSRLLIGLQSSGKSYCQKPTPVPVPTVVPTKVPTWAPTRAPTAAPTSAPTKAPTAIPTAVATKVPVTTQPVCSLGSVNFGQVACSSSVTQLRLNSGGSSSGNYYWTSNCRNAQFDNPSATQPVLSFISSTDYGAPASCLVTLTISGSSVKSCYCSATIAVAPCHKDCAGTINGPAVLDRCGVCGGDGQSCLGCTTVSNVTSLQSLDVQGAALRNVIYSANRLLIAKEKKAKKTVSAQTINKVNKSNASAEAAYQKLWHVTYTIPPVSTSCVNSQFCTQVSTSSAELSYSTYKAQLIAEANASIKRLGRGDSKLQKSIRALQSRRDAAVNKANSALTAVPNISSSCS